MSCLRYVCCAVLLTFLKLGVNACLSFLSVFALFLWVVLTILLVYLPCVLYAFPALRSSLRYFVFIHALFMSVCVLDWFFLYLRISVFFFFISLCLFFLYLRLSLCLCFSVVLLSFCFLYFCWLFCISLLYVFLYGVRMSVFSVFWIVCCLFSFAFSCLHVFSGLYLCLYALLLSLLFRYRFLFLLVCLFTY